MAVGLLLILVVACVGTGFSAMLQRVARRRLAIVPFCALVSWIQLGATLTALPWCLPKAWDTGRFLPLAAVVGACGVCNGLGMALTLAALKRGHAAITNALSQAAMMVPFAFSVVVWKEHVSVWNAAGAVLVLAMFFLVAPGGATEDDPSHRGGSAAWLGLVLLAFAAFGAAQTLYLMPSRWPGSSDWQALRPILLLASQSVVFSLALLAGRGRLTRAMAPLAGGAAGMGIGYLFMVVLAAEAMTRVGLTGLVYPLAVSGATVLFALYSRFVLHEAYTLWSWLGILAGTVGIVLVCIR